MTPLEPLREPLVLLPTPLHQLPRASEELKVELWIKRDDLTGFALGGNKGRKLEYLIAEARERQAEVIVTCGAAQSNFIRHLGAAAAMFGMRCVAVVMDLPFEFEPPIGVELDPSIGNTALDLILGVELIHIPNDTWQVLFEATREVAEDLHAQGRQVYEIPIGGSSALGAYAFYRASREIVDSGETFDWIVTASSSGSTQTGLTYGFHGSATRVLGIASDPEPEFIADIVALGERLSELIGCTALGSDAFNLDLSYCGSGYGVSDSETLSAIEWLAKREGVFLDPIYSGKAFRGLLSLIASSHLAGKILFWHTGGIPTLFALPLH